MPFITRGSYYGKGIKNLRFVQQHTKNFELDEITDVCINRLGYLAYIRIGHFWYNSRNIRINNSETVAKLIALPEFKKQLKNVELPAHWAKP